MAANNRKFGDVVRRQTVREEFKQFVLEKFIDNKWWMKALILLGLGGLITLLAVYVPVILVVAITLIPIYIPVYFWVGHRRRKNWDYIAVVRIKDKKITKEVNLDEDFNMKIETVASKSDAFDLYMAPAKLFSTTASKNTIQEINTIVRKTSDGRTVHIAESMSIEDSDDVSDEDVVYGKRARKTIVLRGTPDETYGNIAILRAVSGITVNVNKKFEKTLDRIMKTGIVEPETVGEIRKKYKEALSQVDTINDKLLEIRDEIGIFPFQPIDLKTLRDDNERAFVVGVGEWKGEWHTKLLNAKKYKDLSPDELMPSILHMVDRARVVDTELTQIQMFQKQRDNKNVLNMFGEFLKLVGWNPEEIKRMTETEAKQKGLLTSTELTQEMTGEDDAEDEEAE